LLERAAVFDAVPPRAPALTLDVYLALFAEVAANGVALCNPLQPNVCEEGKIYIEIRAEAFWAATASKAARALKAMESVHKYSWRRAAACPVARLLGIPCPAWRGCLFRPATRKTAAFCHNNPGIILSRGQAGLGDRASSISLIVPSKKEETIEVYYGRAYVYSQMVSGSQGHVCGVAKNSWPYRTAPGPSS
jgi:cellobiose phosphorylase